MLVDSTTGLYRTDYPGLSQLADRQQALNRYIRKALAGGLGPSPSASAL